MGSLDARRIAALMVDSSGIGGREDGRCTVWIGMEISTTELQVPECLVVMGTIGMS